MKILVAAGGTGGHIYPGLAIADKLKERLPDAEIVFIGSQVGMEKNIVPKEGYPIEYIRVRGFERELSLETLAAVKGIFDGISDSKKVLKRHQPDLVVGTGGFTCGPLLLETAKRGIPTMIHEQNAYPGKTNRMLGKKVDRVAISFKEAAEYFPEDKTFLAGNPVRDVFKQTDRKALRDKLGLKESQRLVVIMGGSQGAGSINNAAASFIVRNADNPEIVVYHLTGRGQYDKVLEKLKENGVKLDDCRNINVLAYSNDVHTLIGAGDLVVSRSGAMSVAEIAAVGIPSILVPYPMAAGNHQEFNARVITDNGGGILIHDAELTPDLLAETIPALLRDEKGLEKMRKATKERAILDAGDRICAEALKLIK
ncbi:undecaprenyldiphospho-muramoylpentapeptide beta-N-acetylglucosaminyltransferase [Eubacterium callanderi]|uniref:undecaprenyldiphospho-muramoylpentapeptide beta-N-acetylglucosaminyltransferase n=1 Tax=Eubacterium callanderi TaxID=53442 RepID=UPI0026736427|nr:undecaprenyldiphospho-muramoylpentapeptide beta-N-acetylglucosaminyltransferase [Eubacterium callanderi]